MASKSQAWKRFARDMQGSSATYAKADISLSKVGQSIPGSWGAGKNTHHATSSYLAKLCIVSGLPFPGSAGDEITAAGGCTYFGSAYSMAPPGGTLPDDLNDAPFQGEELQGTTIVGHLTWLIEGFAAKNPRGPHSINERVIDFDNSRLRIDFAPFAAMLSWQFTDRVVLTHYFLSQDEVDARRHLAPEEAARQMSRVRRSALVSASLLLTAAELLAEVPASAKAAPPSGAGVTTAAPKRETPELHHRAPAPVRENRPHASATRTSETLEDTGVGIFLQSPSPLALRRFHPQRMEHSASCQSRIPIRG